MVSRLKRFKIWLFEGMHRKQKHGQPDHWWRVMCLVGTDYFSSMGFQPSISFVAAGMLAPLATLNLVLLTLFGALPTYYLVAKESPHGQGSFAIFERLLTGWIGKTLVLILLGFAFTDFIFTITMCAADATAHIVENPLVPEFFHDRLRTTLLLIAALGLIFLKGFQDAVKISFALVLFYLAVNAVVITVCLGKLSGDPTYYQNWLATLFAEHSSYLEMFKKAAFVFPQLALGMSGFETGVAVMPLVKGPSHKVASETKIKVDTAGFKQVHQSVDGFSSAIKEDTEDPVEIAGRIKNTRLLLITVAIIMSAFLLVASFITTLMIPAQLFRDQGPANGRALAYLAHLYMGEGFGSVYDAATILILWFAGASGMAALLSLVPQYLPRYGMAPEWASAKRPLVIFFTLVSVFITIVFKADVDAQAGAFATGLLVMITSAALAITALKWRQGLGYRLAFGTISAIFIYSSVVVSLDRPDGLLISFFFIAAVLITSFVSRAIRSTELRIGHVKLDSQASQFVGASCNENLGVIRILAHRPDSADYAVKELEARKNHSIQNEEGDFIFLEVTPGDVSEFEEDTLEVKGFVKDGYRILRCRSASVPNAIAALLLYIRDKTGRTPHAYFAWTEGNPLFYVVKYILLGEGETAPLTREILRVAEEDPEKRPKIHVG